MSIWLQAILCFRPSSDVDFVRPADGVLGCRVWGWIRTWRVGGNRSVVDDSTTLRVLILHELDGFLRAVKNAVQIDIDDGPPLLYIQVFDRYPWRSNAGIVEENIESPESFLGFGEQIFDQCRFGDICWDDECSRTFRASGHRFLQGIFAPPCKGNLVTISQKRQCNASANP